MLPVTCCKKSRMFFFPAKLERSTQKVYNEFLCSPAIIPKIHKSMIEL